MEDPAMSISNFRSQGIGEAFENAPEKPQDTFEDNKGTCF